MIDDTRDHSAYSRVPLANLTLVECSGSARLRACRATKARHVIQSWLPTLLLIASGACAPPDPIDFSTHPDDALRSRSEAPMLRPEWIRLARSIVPAGVAISDFHVGDGVYAYAVLPAADHEGIQHTGFLRELEVGASGLMAGGPSLEGIRVIGTAESTFVWQVERETGRLWVEDVAGNRRQRGQLQVRDSVLETCLTSQGWVYFTDPDYPAVVRQQPFVDSALPRLPVSLPLPPALTGQTQPLAARGSMSSYCAFFANGSDSLYVLDGAAGSFTAHEFVESTRAVLSAESGRERWRRSWHELGRAPTGALDVAVQDQLIAVLFRGRSTQAGRIVDLYAPEKGYLGSLRLPMRTERIALAHQRLYALARDSERAYLVSFVLPAEYRQSAVDEMPTLQGRNIPWLDSVGGVFDFPR